MLEGLTVNYEDGEIVFSEGDAAADMYVVRSGAVRITRTGDDGSVVVLATLGEGEFFGEMGLFSPGLRSASATAVGATELAVIDKTAFMGLVRDPVVWEVLAKMSERIRAADEALAEAGIETVQGTERLG